MEGPFEAVLRNDGNFVVIRTRDEHIVWSALEGELLGMNKLNRNSQENTFYCSTILERGGGFKAPFGIHLGADRVI
jgi:hypothetical protein